MNDLKLAMLRKFGSQIDFALEVGDHQSIVSLILNHRRQLNKERAERWAKVLGVGLDVLAPFMLDPRKTRKGGN